jgi:hypothetical protein
MGSLAHYFSSFGSVMYACAEFAPKGPATASQRSHAKKNAKRRALLKRKQAANEAPATTVALKKGRRAPVPK